MSDIGINEAARHAVKQIELIERVHGPIAALEFAGGMASGIKQYIQHKHGPHAAYDLLSGLADLSIENELTRG